jgi:putative membrane protein
MERTRMAADRTLMASLRTSLALIGFGFTIVKFFQEVGKKLEIESAMASPARNFGITLVVLGIALLVVSLFNHRQLARDHRRRRDDLHAKQLLQHASSYQTSPTAVVSVMLLVAALLVTLGIVARVGPYHMLG